MKTLTRVQRNPQAHWVGDGFPVRNLLSYNDPSVDLSPFLLLDYAGPRVFEPSTKRRGVGKHPHRGFETVTIVYDGEVEHKDSTGAGGQIGPGDVQWMTAASGVIHEEYHGQKFSRRGGTFELIQVWVNLPARDKMAAPRYQSIRSSEIPKVTLANGAGELRVIAGHYESAIGPAQTHSPLDLWDVRINAGQSVRLPLREGDNTGLFVMHGRIQVVGGAALTPVGPVELAIFSQSGTEVKLQADEETRMLVMSGQPLNEPVVGYGPFVMNTEQEIRQALKDFRVH